MNTNHTTDPAPDDHSARHRLADLERKSANGNAPIIADPLGPTRTIRLAEHTDGRTHRLSPGEEIVVKNESGRYFVLRMGESKTLDVGMGDLAVDEPLSPGDSITVSNQCDTPIKVCTGRILTDWKSTLASERMAELEEERDRAITTAVSWIDCHAVDADPEKGLSRWEVACRRVADETGLAPDEVNRIAMKGNEGEDAEL